MKNYANYFLDNSETSSSVVNDIFIKLWSNDHEIENAKAYLFRSVKNASLKHLTSQRKKTISYLDTHYQCKKVIYSRWPEERTGEVDSARFEVWSGSLGIL
ncbi:sigma factor [Pedobacter jamesrossensis]|uniref:Sigma factor n=1 Tax=Pedobacter jamesrossensis TaxID=1908238 RepID=A0ABV8NNQ1_9SPHI